MGVKDANKRKEQTMSMISDLVERLRTEAKSMGTYGTDYMATLLTRSADTIEMLSEKAREPKHGEWIVSYIDGIKQTKCSACGVSFITYDVYGWRYCPWCGARMKGADDE